MLRKKLICASERKLEYSINKEEKRQGRRKSTEDKMRYRDRQRWSTELSTVKEIDKLKQRPHTDCEGVPNLPRIPSTWRFLCWCWCWCPGCSVNSANSPQTAPPLMLLTAQGAVSGLKNFRNTVCLKKILTSLFDRFFVKKNYFLLEV